MIAECAGCGKEIDNDPLLADDECRCDQCGWVKEEELTERERLSGGYWHEWQ